MKKTSVFAVLCLLLALISGCGSKEARSVDSLISAIGEVDASCGPVVEYVRNEYEMLSSEERNEVKKYDTLLAAEAAYVDAVIDSIGEVTAQSDALITAAENAYEAIAEDAKIFVKGVDILNTAREECDKEILLEELSGIWVNEVLGSRNTNIGRGLIRSYGLDETDCDTQICTFELKPDMSVFSDETEVGTWELSETKTEVNVVIRTEREDEHQSLRIMEEDGYVKLVGQILGNNAFAYVKESEYAGAFSKKYVAAALSKDNIHEYIGEPVSLGKVAGDNKDKYNAYLYPSAVYEDGLVYLGSSCILRVDYVHGGSKRHSWLDYPMMFLTKLKVKDVGINTAERVTGEIYYIKSEYVENNYISPEGFRVLELTNGVRIVFNGYENIINTFWNRADAAYSDYMY